MRALIFNSAYKKWLHGLSALMMAIFFCWLTVSLVLYPVAAGAMRILASNSEKARTTSKLSNQLHRRIAKVSSAFPIEGTLTRKDVVELARAEKKLDEDIRLLIDALHAAGVEAGVSSGITTRNKDGLLEMRQSLKISGDIKVILSALPSSKGSLGSPITNAVITVHEEGKVDHVSISLTLVRRAALSK